MISRVPAMRNCVSNGVRTSRCRADFFRLSKFRCGLPSRRAPYRLAALLTAFRLIYRVLPTPGFHRWERPSFLPWLDLNQHTKARAIELQGRIKKRPAVAERFVCWPLGLEADGPSPIVRGGFKLTPAPGYSKFQNFIFLGESVSFSDTFPHRGDSFYF